MRIDFLCAPKRHAGEPFEMLETGFLPDGKDDFAEDEHIPTVDHVHSEPRTLASSSSLLDTDRKRPVPSPAPAAKRRKAPRQADFEEEAEDSDVEILEDEAREDDPTSIEELCRVLMPAKVKELRQALVASLASQGPKMILLHGPTGCGKSITLSLLAKELKLTVRTWDHDRTARKWNPSGSLESAEVPYVSPIEEFERFLLSSGCGRLALRSSRPAKRASESREEGILYVLESLPAVYSEGTRGERFVPSLKEAQAILLEAVSRLPRRAALVYVHTSERDAKASAGQIAQVVGERLSGFPLSAVIGFNAVPPKRLEKLLILKGSSGPQAQLLAEASNGDARSALNAVRFHNIVGRSRFKKGSAGLSASVRDESYHFLHTVGKLARFKRLQDGRVGFDPDRVAAASAMAPENLAAFLHHLVPTYIETLEDHHRVLDCFSAADCFSGAKWKSQRGSNGHAHRDEENGEDALVTNDVFALSLGARAAALIERPVALTGPRPSVTKPPSFSVHRSGRERREALLALASERAGNWPRREFILFAPFNDELRRAAHAKRLGGFEAFLAPDRAKQLTRLVIHQGHETADMDA